MVLPHNTKTEKKFTNFCYHKDDFDMDAKWYFFEMSHGKGACDGWCNN
jgi:hypothetical protein